MDREKVIKALEYCKDNQLVSDCEECDYGGKTGMFCIRMIDDAIALLKEQEPKPVGKEWNECPSCGKVLDRIHDMHYCGVCGQAVKWDA